MITDAELAAFWTGFELATAPGRAEIDALERAEEVAPAGPDQLRVAVPKDLAKAFLAEVEAAPEDLAGAVWLGFLRGLIARAGGAPVHVHEVGAA